MVVQYYEHENFIATTYGFEVRNTEDGALTGTIVREQCGGASIGPGAEPTVVIAACLGSGEILWIETADGSVQASAEVPGEVFGRHRAKEDEIFGPVVIGDRVVIAQANGILHSFDAESGEALGANSVALAPDRLVRGVVATASGDLVLAVGPRGLGSLDTEIDELRLVQLTSAEEMDRIDLDGPAAFLGSVDGQPVVLDFPDGRIRVFEVDAQFSDPKQVDLDFMVQSLPLPPD